MTLESEISEPKGLRDLWHSPFVGRVRLLIRALIKHLNGFVGELTALVLSLVIFSSFFLTSALSRQNTNVSFLRPNLQIWFAETFNGQSAEFGNLDISWTPTRDTLTMSAVDVVIKDVDNAPLEQFELLQATLKFDPSRFVPPELIKAEVRGGIVSYVEDERGNITIGLGPPENVGKLGPVFRNDNKSNSENKFSFAGLETVIFSDAILHYQNAVTDMDLTARLHDLAITMSEDQALVYEATGEIKQGSEPAFFSTKGVSDLKFDVLRTRFDLEGAWLDQIGPKAGRYSDLSGIEAPLNLSGEIDFNKKDGLQSATIDLEIGAGAIQFLRGKKRRIEAFHGLLFRADLEPGNDQMVIDAFDLSCREITFSSTGNLSELGNLSDGDINSSPVFDLHFDMVEVPSSKVWEKDININSLYLKGRADFDARSLDVIDGKLSIFGADFQFNHYLKFDEENRPADLNIKANMSGKLVREDILSAWPESFIGGARRWFDRSIISGRLENIDLNLNLGPTFFETRKMQPQQLLIDFEYLDGEVKYMETMPAARGVQAFGQVQGNSLGLTYNGGQIDTLNLTSGRVDIPVIFPKGGDIIIHGLGNGQASDMMQILDNPPFNFATRYGIDPTDIGGAGDLDLKVTRPLLEFFPRDRIDYEISGKFSDVKAPFQIGQFEINQGQVDLDVTRDRMIMSGPVNIGPWQTMMRWQETFGDNAPPTQYSVSGTVNADLLDKLGVASRGWFSGEAYAQIEASGRGTDVKDATVKMDLTPAILSLERVWMKSEGETASLEAKVLRDVETGYDIDLVSLMGPELSVSGAMSLEKDFKLKRLSLDEISIQDLMEGTLNATRRDDRIIMDMVGSYLDISPWTEDVFQRRQNPYEFPFDLTATLDRLVLNPNYEISDAGLSIKQSAVQLDAANLSGSRNGDAFKLDLSTGESGIRFLDISIPDASDALSAFLGLENSSGGALQLDAKLPPAGREGALIGQAKISDFRLTEAPAMAQLLSLASLTGLADTLSSGSMKFEEFVVPFTWKGDLVSVRDARLYGPALGMTADGDIDIGLRVLDFDGTLVPAYTANSILGDIPVLGDIFVGEKGGGTFALTYTVSGPFETTQIAVNPLSALTPGFLRQIFKPSRDDVPEDVLEKIKDVAPVPDE